MRPSQPKCLISGKSALRQFALRLADLPVNSFSYVHSLAEIAATLLNILSKCANISRARSYDEEEIQPRRAEATR